MICSFFLGLDSFFSKMRITDPSSQEEGKIRYRKACQVLNQGRATRWRPLLLYGRTAQATTSMAACEPRLASFLFFWGTVMQIKRKGSIDSLDSYHELSLFPEL